MVMIMTLFGIQLFTGAGTVINALAVAIGGIIGMLVGGFLKERYRETIIKIIGFGTITMAIGGVVSKMLVLNIENTENGFVSSFDTQGTIMMIVSLGLGALIGEIINIDKWFEDFGGFLKEKTGSQKDNRFIDAFVTASLTVCVGAMAIMGSITEGINGDPSILISKSVIDFIFIITLAASMGKGCIFASIPILIIQGLTTLLATVIAPAMTTAAINNLSLVGNVLIMCVGVNIVWPKTIRVANLLPCIVVAVVFAFV